MHNHFAALIPVGPGALESTRTVDLLDSLFTYEPAAKAVIIDDTHGSGLAAQLQSALTSAVTIIRHPRAMHTDSSLGPLCAGVLFGIEYIYNSAPVDFIVKLDTDALVIGSFSDKLGTKLADCPEAGVLGTLGYSCNPDNNGFDSYAVVTNRLREALEIARLHSINPAVALERLRSWGITDDQQVRALMSLCDRFSPLAQSAFAGQHCQGGAYALSPTFIDGMYRRGFLSDRASWTHVPFGEDRMIGLYCSLLGLDAVAYSSAGEVFGVQAVGLAYAPDELVARGYSIIHSLKARVPGVEESIREGFTRRRHG